jgi:hypothetical protein
MPNWVDNILTFDADEETAKKIRDIVLDERGQVTFQKLIPRPEELDITNRSSGICDTDLDGFNNKDNFFAGIAPKHADIVATGAEFVCRYYEKYVQKKAEDIPKFNNQIVEAKVDMKGIELLSKPYADGINKEPAEFVQAIKNKIQFGYSTWYRWNIENWGCKWDASETYASDLNSYQFNTPWSPPGPWLEALSNAFPEVTFILEYHDEDPSNNGRYEVKAGELIQSEHWSEPYPTFDEDGPDPETEAQPATGDDPSKDEAF